jgi:glycosyltransferase involved in cell wall biosynthesis
MSHDSNQAAAVSDDSSAGVIGEVLSAAGPSGFEAGVILLAIALAITLVSLAMTVRNLARYRIPVAAGHAGSVAVCIPARNEAANLEACVESALASADSPGGDGTVDLEVLVYDDGSTDGTGSILASLVARDPRVRAVETVPLPSGWNGKQHGCDRMGRAATKEWLLFTDADVRFAPRSLGGVVATAESKGVDLLSTFPRQEMTSFGERLFIPMIGFILFSYLPMGRMQRTLDPAASAGCGQYLFVRREAWLACGGHAAFRDSMHDGIKLPRLLRRHGHRTDLFDGTSIVSCRMYDGFGACWRGFAKNAFEGLGSIGLLAFVSVLHLVGHVMPWAFLLAAAFVPAWRSPWAIALALAAIAVALLQRTLLARRLAQPVASVAWHPLAILLSIAVQWRSWWLHVTGRRTWRGRTAGEGGLAST